MQITVQNIDMNTLQTLPGSTAAGYRCEFRSEIGGGRALFIPAPDKRSIDEMTRQAEVALSGEELTGLQTIQTMEDFQFKLKPLPTPGDFTGTGKIASVVWLEDAGEYSVIEVLLGDSVFPVSPESIGDTELEYGQWVSFQIHQLLLWEQPAAFLPGS